MAQHPKTGSSKHVEVDEEIKRICKDMKEPVIEKAKSENISFDFKVFDPVDAMMQVVAGKNYFMKVKIDDTNYIFIRVYQNLKNRLSLSKVQWNKTENDELVYF